MEKDERVKRYMEILQQCGEGNSTRNWKILDKLTDDELYDNAKIETCIDIIRTCNKRDEDNPNKYPEYIMRHLRQRYGLNEYDDSKDSEINAMPEDNVLAAVCNWNGLLGYAGIIKSWIEDIYKIKLDAKE